jgi:hypothetical protein
MMNSTLTRTDYKSYFEQGIPYAEYARVMELKNKGEVADIYPQYIGINLQRSQRVYKTTQLTPELESYLSTLHHPVLWLLITEHWCGDSAQIAPIIGKVADASNGKIDLRIVSRDQHLPLIDAHLTPGANGTPGRAIPKLLQLDTEHRLTAVWGPRPNEAQKLVHQLKSNPETAGTYQEALHKWYAQDKGLSTQRDLLKMLKIGAALCPDCRAH